MGNLYFTSWDPLTGSRNQTNRFRAADIIKRFGGNRDLDYYLALESDCETGELHILDRPMLDCVFHSEVAFPFKFDPTYCRYRLGDIQNKPSPCNIAVCHKGDLFAPWVPDQIIREVLEEAARIPDHNYFFLTRFPKRYSTLPKLPSNFILGVWIDQQKDLQKLWEVGASNVRYLVMEPMRTQIRLEEYLQKSATKPEWIILGAGRHKYLSQIQKSWIEEIIWTCEQHQIPIYIKKSLNRLVGAITIQQKPLQFNI